MRAVSIRWRPTLLVACSADCWTRSFPLGPVLPLSADSSTCGRRCLATHSTPWVSRARSPSVVPLPWAVRAGEEVPRLLVAQQARPLPGSSDEERSFAGSSIAVVVKVVVTGLNSLWPSKRYGGLGQLGMSRSPWRSSNHGAEVVGGQISGDWQVGLAGALHQMPRELRPHGAVLVYERASASGCLRPGIEHG